MLLERPGAPRRHAPGSVPACRDRGRGAGYLDAVIADGQVGEQPAGAAHVLARQDQLNSAAASRTSVPASPTEQYTVMSAGLARPATAPATTALSGVRLAGSVKNASG